MNLSDTEFDYILQNGESYYVEFKERVNSTLSREFISFANASGGKIYLGVSDKGQVVGIEVSNKLKSQIQDIANNCNPPVAIHIHEFKNVLIVEIPEGKDKPYQCADGFFIRMGTNAQKMNRDRIVEFLQAEGQIRFEEQLHKKYDIAKDFVSQKLKAYLEQAGITSSLDNESLLINLGVAERLDGKLRMNNAGVLFFTESIQLLCEQATITCGVFDGIDRVQVLNRKDYTMDMVSNINNTLHFIKQELRVKYEMTGTARRREVYEIPLDAFREAVINAVMHRDYFLFGSHVTVDIFDDRIEISNPGGLPKGLKQEEFGKKSVRRNPLIASLLHRINLVENMGSGIGKIKELLQKAGAPQPLFKFGEFYTIIFPRPQKFLGKNEPPNEPLNEPLNQLLQAIRKNPKISKDDLAIQLDRSRSTITRQIQKLREQKYIRRVGSDKTGHWEVEGNE